MPGRGLAVVLLTLMGVALGACNESPENTGDAPASLAPKPNELPPLELRDDTQNLLLTWVDDKGDFHVVTTIEEVPDDARDRVRVVVATRKAGTGRLFYVADLRQPGPDGTYPVRTMTRAEWEEIGASRRQARLEALAPSARPPRPTPSAAPSAAQPEKAEGRDELVAVVYGADWCKPCDAAVRYLKRLGVEVVKKDVESDQLAAREMQDKLRRANLPPNASIPIIDVGGQLLMGYSPQALQRAVEAARGAKPL